MALTLDATLKTAQDGNDHKPIISLFAGKAVADLPLSGNYITHDNDQTASQPLLLGDGSLAIVYTGVGWNGDFRELRVIFSDENQESFGNFVVIDDETYEPSYFLDAIVLDSSDNIGIICTRQNASYFYINAYKITNAGVKTSETAITDVGASYRGDGVAVLKKGDNDYAAFWPAKLNGTDWTIQMATSTDFTTWGSPAPLSIGGLTSTSIISDPKIIKLADGSYFMVFSYQNIISDTGSIKNIYYTTSTDLSTWADALPVTTTTNMAKDYIQPDVVQQSDGSVFIMTNETNNLLQIDKTDFDANDLALGPTHYSNTTGNVYFTSGGSEVTKAVIAVVDMATFDVVKYYDVNSTPPIPPYLAGSAPSYDRVEQGHSDEHLVLLYNGNAICVVDTEADTIKTYYFYDQSATYGVEAEKNVTWEDQSPGQFVENIHGAHIDAANSKMYVLLVDSYLYTQYFRFGYIDLTESTAPYTFTDIGTFTNYASGYQGVARPFHIYPNDNVMVTHGNGGLSGDEGTLWVWDIVEGTALKRYRRSVYPEFPHGGFYDSVYANDKIWALTIYTTNYASDQYKKGLAEINLTTDQIIYHECPWEPGIENDMQRMSFCNATDELIISNGSIVATFNIVTQVWGKHEYDISGNLWYAPIYNPTNGAFYLPKQTGGGIRTSGVFYMLPRDGTLDMVKYVTGDYTTSWAFAAPETAIYGFENTKPALAITANNSIYSTWTDSENSESWIKWDKTGASLNLLDYLIDEVSVTRNIAGDPHSLSFSLSHGHLFDPTNTNSIVNFYLTKGNLVELKIGENISSVDYYADQGTFTITALDVSYINEQYPTIKVSAQDRRVFWDNHVVAVSVLSETYPETAMETIAKAEMAKLTTEDFTFPQFNGRFTFDAQWINTPLKDIMEQIANRFGYFITVTVDDKITARPITLTAATDHTYSNKDQFFEFSPDDSYSDFTNRILVTGQSLDELEVLHDEERVSSLNGTIGWWGFNKDFKIYYSEDQSKRAKYPRLEVIETSTSIMFKLAGKITEQISEIDNIEHQWCIVEVKAPNLIPVLLVAISLIAAGMLAFDWATVTGSPVAQTGPSWSVGRIIANAGMIMAMMVLGSIGNFQYAIWAQPIGYVKRQVSAYEDDLILQQKIGEIIVEQIDGFLCNTAIRCKDVAEFEMLVTKAQRNRVKVKKIAHLQDQEGDTISFPHPYTGNEIKMFVTDLRRTYKQTTETSDGYFYDELEGWVIIT